MNQPDIPPNFPHFLLPYATYDVRAALKQAKEDREARTRARTDYSIQRRQHADNASRYAESIIYPLLFPGCKYQDVDIPEQERLRIDYEEATDRIMDVVKSDGTTYRVCIQERFRYAKYAQYEDVTISTYNLTSNTKGELFKLKYTDYFVYGYYSDEENKLVGKWIVCRTPALLKHIRNKSVRCERRYNKETNQFFIAIKFSDLLALPDVVAAFSEWNKDK